jgi:thiol-disulfide isomerase/thioredoxin
MKNLVASDRTKKQPASIPHVHDVSTLAEYKRLVADEKDKITVVRFYASWCKSCQRTKPMFTKLAEIYHDEINFVQVSVGVADKVLTAGLAVDHIPLGHVYHPTCGLTEELSMNRKYFKAFAQIVRSYRDEECKLPDLDAETGIYEAPYARQS